MAVSKKLNINLPYDTAIPVLGTYPREMKMLVYITTCMGMFLGRLFIIQRYTGKNPNVYQLVNEKNQNVVYLYIEILCNDKK